MARKYGEKPGQNVHGIPSFLASTSKAHEMFSQESVGGSLKNLQGQLLKPFLSSKLKKGTENLFCAEHMWKQTVFSPCVKFRKAAMKNSAEGELTIQVPATLPNAVDSTLCPKPEGASFHNIKCLQRECDQYGVDLFTLRPEESADKGSVHWSRYNYSQTGKFHANGQEKKKISLIQKETPPSELFKYFKKLLSVYPYHSSTFLQVMW